MHQPEAPPQLPRARPKPSSRRTRLRQRGWQQPCRRWWWNWWWDWARRDQQRRQRRGDGAHGGVQPAPERQVPDAFPQSAQEEFLADVARGLGFVDGPGKAEERVKIVGFAAGSLVVETQVVGFATPEEASDFSVKASISPPNDVAKYGPCAFAKLPGSVARRVSGKSELARRAMAVPGVAAALASSSSSSSSAVQSPLVAALRVELQQAKEDLAAAEDAAKQVRSLQTATAKAQDEAEAVRPRPSGSSRRRRCRPRF